MFEISPMPGGPYSILFSFGPLSPAGTNMDGATPYAGSLPAASGNFYGTAQDGGKNGAGTVFSITPRGVLHVVHTFTFAGGGAAVPAAGLIQDALGNFFGTTTSGGRNGTGTLYEITNTRRLQRLFSFDGLPAGGTNTTGAAPLSTGVGLTQLAANVFIGTASHGGASGLGTVFTIQLVPKIAVTVGSLIMNANGSYTAKLLIKNTGSFTASSAMLTASTLGGAATTSTLPVNLGNIAPGSSAVTSLDYPSSAGTPGSTVYLKTAGAYSGGTWRSSTRVVLP